MNGKWAHDKHVQNHQFVGKCKLKHQGNTFIHVKMSKIRKIKPTEYQ